jgi:hypothetical protein
MEEETMSASHRKEKMTASKFSEDDIHRYVEDLGNKNGMVRQKARQTLVSMGRAALDLLAELSTHPKAVIRWEAVKALGQISDPAAAPVFINALEDENSDVRWLAAKGLIFLGKDGLISILEALAEFKTTVFLKEGAHHIVKALYPKFKSAEMKNLISSLGNRSDNSTIPMNALAVLHSLRKSHPE